MPPSRACGPPPSTRATAGPRSLWAGQPAVVVDQMLAFYGGVCDSTVIDGLVDMALHAGPGGSSVSRADAPTGATCDCVRRRRGLVSTWIRPAAPTRSWPPTTAGRARRQLRRNCPHLHGPGRLLIKAVGKGAKRGIGASSRLLGASLESAGFVRLEGEAAHHIVAGRSLDAAPGRPVLDKAGQVTGSVGWMPIPAIEDRCSPARWRGAAGDQTTGALPLARRDAVDRSGPDCQRYRLRPITRSVRAASATFLTRSPDTWLRRENEVDYQLLLEEFMGRSSHDRIPQISQLAR